MKLKIQVQGTAPYIMHKFTPTEEKTSTRGKKVYIPEEEAEKVAYRNEKGQLVIPSSHFKAAMVKAATDFIAKGKRSYKDFVKSGIIFEQENILIKPQEYEVFTCPVVVNRSRIARSRPLIKNWSCEFVFEIIDETWLNKTTLKEILEAAGKYKGIGDQRPEYGRFVVTKMEELK